MRVRQALVNLAVCLGLVVSVIAVYAQVGRFEFVDYDDSVYVFNNPRVMAGVTPGGIKWALTAVVGSNRTPVTLLSHMLDCQLFGMESGMHHLVNVLLHMLSSLVLFAVLLRATGTTGPSAFVAFVFALHPLHVGSVAWIAERKDMLSALFWFLALYAYVRYTERPNRVLYLLVLALFGLGLMSKPMVVTFPFALLLFDVWPLRRMQWPKIVWEKIPLFVFSAIASALTYRVQSGTGSVKAPAFGVRIGNALISYVVYLRQTFWPTHLSVFYPYPHSIAVWPVVGAFALILGVSALVAVLAWRTRPYLAVGWFWYLGTLVPVIGLVQVGEQAHADRYMYIPMVGLNSHAGMGRGWIWPRNGRAKQTCHRRGGGGVLRDVPWRSPGKETLFNVLAEQRDALQARD